MSAIGLVELLEVGPLLSRISCHLKFFQGFFECTSEPWQSHLNYSKYRTMHEKCLFCTNLVYFNLVEHA